MTSNLGRSLPKIPAEYYDWLRRGLEKVELLGAKEGRAVTLDHVYVPALTRPAPAPAGSAAGKSNAERQKNRNRSHCSGASTSSLTLRAGAGRGRQVHLLPLGGAAEHRRDQADQRRFRRPQSSPSRCRRHCATACRCWCRSTSSGRKWTAAAASAAGGRGDLERSLAQWIDGSPPDGLTGSLLLAHLTAGTAFLLLDGILTRWRAPIPASG